MACNQKELQEGLLSDLEDPYTILFVLKDETRRYFCGEKLVLDLSLLQIEPKAAEKVIDDALSSLSHGPIITLIRAHTSKSGFVSNEALA